MEFDSKYSKKNKNKKKIVVFRTGGMLAHETRFYYSGQEIETVNSFNYLGVLFSCGGCRTQSSYPKRLLRQCIPYFRLLKM